MNASRLHSWPGLRRNGVDMHRAQMTDSDGQNDAQRRPETCPFVHSNNPDAMHDLQRFVSAQAPVFDTICGELAAGAKRSHWMWFVFPQLRGLGRSATARHYGLASAAEALTYWRHPLLGARLLQCTRLVLAVPAATAATAHAIFGSPDDLKLRSCMSLFAAVAPQEPAFPAVLQRFWQGAPDTATLALLAA